MSTLLAEKNKNKFLLLIVLLALTVRLWVVPVVFSNGNITLLGADTYYHARRILATVAHFPGTLAFDSYINFPYGSGIGWAPLYDQFIALIALVAGAGKPSLYTIEATTAAVPLLLGVLTVLLVFLITEKLFDWQVGLVSAGIFAITPSHVYVSFLGYADHHVAETLLSTAAYLFFIVAMERMQKNNISFDNFRTNLFKNSLFPALTGIALALSIFTWDGAPIFVGLIGIYIPIQFVIDRKVGRSSDYLVITGGTAFLVSLLIITPVDRKSVV
jgi:dolichyl-diphosphooligosaccharide--protein glycosyltransferase